MVKSKTPNYKKKINLLEKELDEKNRMLFNKDSISLDNLTDFEAFTIKPNRSLKEQCTAITQFGDGHFDEIVNPNVTNGLNEYNPEIARKRTERYASRLIYMLRLYKRAGIKINNLVLHLVGDFISGWIHEELVQTNAMSPVQATLFAEELLIKCIKTIGEYEGLNKIVIVCNTGNHSRITKRNQFKNSVETSFEYLSYKHIEEHFKNNGYQNIEFIIPVSPIIYYKVYDKMNLFTHGNRFQYQGGIGGIEVPLKKWLHRENTVMPFDMAWMGHWHQYLCGTKIRINGPVIGYNEMGRYYGFTPEPPMMQFQLLDEKRGYTWNCPIILEDF